MESNGQRQCFGCGAMIDAFPGNHYCAACVEGQEKEQGDEAEAFDAYHKWIDSIPKS